MRHLWVLAVLLLPLSKAHAWGREGHEIIALIADQYLTDTTRTRVVSLLQADASGLTAQDMASEAVWADRFRDSDRYTSADNYRRTRRWHYANMDITKPDMDATCYRQVTAPDDDTPASEKTPMGCVVDKVVEFQTELELKTTTPEERLLALQFLLHLIGDLHQPLHLSGDGDSGGNKKTVQAPDGRTDSLHEYWDSEFIKLLGPSSSAIAQELVNSIRPAQVETWAKGDPVTWGKEAFEVGKRFYAKLPLPGGNGVYLLSSEYVRLAKMAVKLQLKRAGIRLAGLLNAAFGH